MGKGGAKKKEVAEVEAPLVLTAPIELSKFGDLKTLRELCKAQDDAVAKFDEDGEGDPDERPASFDVNSYDKDGNTAVMWSVRNGHTETTKWLIERGANIELQGFGGLRCVHFAVLNNLEMMLTELLEHNGDINARDACGHSALHFAATRGVMNIVVKLIDRSADVNLANEGGVRPLHKACGFGNTQVVATLIEYGADVEACDSEGDTALHYAARAGFTGPIELLLKNKASPKMKNKKKQTPADVALDENTQNKLAEA